MKCPAQYEDAHRLPEFIYAKVCEQKKDRWEIAAAAVMSA